MLSRISLCYRVGSLLVALLFLNDVKLSIAQADAADSTGGITKVVLQGKTGTFTHRRYIAPGERLRLRVYAEDITDVISSLKLEPAHKLIVVKPEDLLNPRAIRLHPDVLNLGTSGGVDFNVEEFWKRLLGQPVSLLVNEDGLSAQVKGILTLGDAEKTSLGGEMTSRTKSQYRVSGSFLGFGKEGDGPQTLKILAGGGKRLVEIPKTAVVSIDFEGTITDDLQTALNHLKRKYSADTQTLIIERVGEKASGKKNPPPNSTITYHHSLANECEIQFKGKRSEGGKVSVIGWAQVWNETPYEWRDVEVTLKTADAEYKLLDVDLKSGKTNWFEIRFPENEDPDNEGTLSMSLDATRRLEINVPDATKKGVPCIDNLLLVNRNHYALPAGPLVIHDFDYPNGGDGKILGNTTNGIPSNTPKAEPVPVKLSVFKGIVADYTKKKELTIAKVVGIAGPKLKYHSGHSSTIQFRSIDDSVRIVCVLPGQLLVGLKTKAESCSCGDLCEINLLPEERFSGKMVELIVDEKKPGTLSVRQSYKEVKTKKLTALNLADLKEAKDSGLPKDLRSVVDLLIEKNKAIRDGKEKEKRLVEEIKQLEARKQVHLSKNLSRHSGAIGRRFATLIWQKEKELAARRDELAIARYDLDHYIRYLRVRPSQ